MGAINRLSVGFPWHLPSAGGSARAHGTAWLAKAPPKALPWLQCTAGRGPRTSPPILGVLWGVCLQGQVVFVESRGRTGRCPELSWMEAWACAILKEIVGGKAVTPGRELGASSTDCHARLTPCLVKRKKNQLKTWGENK